MKKWDDINEIDGETSNLVNLVLNGWDWQWPGWGWVAATLNKDHGNDRSPGACRKKYDRYEE
ncbi:unnamed protein product, partial [marine sediment metagenome]